MSNQLVSWIQDHSVLILAGLAVVEGIICLSLLRMARHARHEMKAAQAAAIEAARSAALAAPGAIDPEAVLALLRQGHAPTLDNVYAMMRRREAESAQSAGAQPDKPAPAPVAAATRAGSSRNASPEKVAEASPVAAPTTSLSASEVEERLRRYER
ncbi:MAG TPA: hypothetical protein VND88_13730 [Candidatus Acidoferrales bacterium]|nr:hypothetical protein [Candidatus Acidoferrales bacterium]